MNNKFMININQSMWTISDKSFHGPTGTHSSEVRSNFHKVKFSEMQCKNMNHQMQVTFSNIL